MNRFVAYNMPKIDLHCHLDGSMSPAVTGRLLKELGEEYGPKELEALLSAPADCPDCCSCGCRCFAFTISTVELYHFSSPFSTTPNIL